MEFLIFPFYVVITFVAVYTVIMTGKWNAELKAKANDPLEDCGGYYCSEELGHLDCSRADKAA